MDKLLKDQLGMQAASGAINTGIGLLTANFNDRRQLEQQRKLNEIQQAAQMAMWEKTNYKAQREQMQKAGLNVGLMYGMGGGGGTTVGNTVGGTAPMGGGELGMGMMTKAQLALIAAQTENVKADTKSKEAGIPKTGAETKNIDADTANKQLQNRLLQIQESVQTQTIAESVQQIQAAARESLVRADIAEETKEAHIEQTQIATYQAVLNTFLTKAQIQKTGSDTAKNQAQIKEIAKRIWKIGVDVAQKGQELDQEQQRIAISDALKDMEREITDFKTSTPEQLKQWTGLTQEAVKTIMELQKLAPIKKIGFK